MLKLVDRAAFFREVTLRISSNLEAEKALESTFQYLRQYIPIDAILLGYLDPDSNSVYTVARVDSENGAIAFDGRHPMLIMDAEGFNQIRESRENTSELLEKMAGGYRVDGITVLNRPLDESILADYPTSLRNMVKQTLGPSNMMMDLFIQEHEVGMLLMSSNRTDAFTREHAQLLNLVKEPIAMALSNARRFQETLRLKDQLAEENKTMRQEFENIVGIQLIGIDFGLRQVMEKVRQVAPLSSPVLLLGETGTGKEVIANIIHMLSPRQDKAIIRVQCGAIPDTLLDSELFGHEKGAFTGALTSKKGRFERADGGTIFLDEIAELTLDAQVKFLRVLQEKQIERLGNSETIDVDVRVIAATNRNLEEMVKNGRFREDLWYRLNVFPIHIPPLRQRKEDIPSLIQYFIERKARELNLRKIPAVLPHAVDKLIEYDWPGNVRELQNIIERALIVSNGRPLEFHDANLSRKATSGPSGLQTGGKIAPLDEIQRTHILEALQTTRGKIHGDGGAAQLLGINPNTLRARMKKLDIPFGRKAGY